MNAKMMNPELTLKERQASQRFLYRELLRLSTMIDENLREPQVFGLMSALVRKAKSRLTADDQPTRLAQLLDFLYREQGFHCHYEAYFHTENLQLDCVLRRKRGMPVSLGAVLLYLAATFELPLYPVNFPTQLVVRAEIITASGRKETHFINPWNGEFLSLSQMEKWLEGEMGFGAELSREDLRIAHNEELLERLETVFKMALSREGRYEETLKIIEYRLACQPDDPYEIRDRGMVLASMDCFQAAVDDLSYFIDQCPDDPSAVMLKLEIAGLEKQGKANPIH